MFKLLYQLVEYQSLKHQTPSGAAHSGRRGIWFTMKFLYLNFLIETIAEVPGLYKCNTIRGFKSHSPAECANTNLEMRKDHSTFNGNCSFSRDLGHGKF